MYNDKLSYAQRPQQRTPAFGACAVSALSKKSGNIFRAGIFLDFVTLTTRAEGPHGAYVRGAN